MCEGRLVLTLILKAGPRNSRLPNIAAAELSQISLRVASHVCFSLDTEKGATGPLAQRSGSSQDPIRKVQNTALLSHSCGISFWIILDGFSQETYGWLLWPCKVEGSDLSRAEVGLSVVSCHV